MNNNKSVIFLNGVYYCAFCGKPISKNSDGLFLCNCQDAENYRMALHEVTQLNIKASEIMQNAPKPKFHPMTVIAPISDKTSFQPDDSDWVPSNPL